MDLRMSRSGLSIDSVQREAVLPRTKILWEARLHTTA